jgi:hypothetical protein
MPESDPDELFRGIVLRALTESDATCIRNVLGSENRGKPVTGTYRSPAAPQGLLVRDLGDETLEDIRTAKIPDEARPLDPLVDDPPAD